MGRLGAATGKNERAIIGGSPLDGWRAVVSSRYFSGIAAYVLILAIIATFRYFTRLQMVAALGEDTQMRTTVFAQIDTIVQVSTLVLQLFVAGHLMKKI